MERLASLFTQELSEIRPMHTNVPLENISPPHSSETAQRAPIRRSGPERTKTWLSVCPLANPTHDAPSETYPGWMVSWSKIKRSGVSSFLALSIILSRRAHNSDSSGFGRQLWGFRWVIRISSGSKVIIDADPERNQWNQMETNPTSTTKKSGIQNQNYIIGASRSFWWVSCSAYLGSLSVCMCIAIEPLICSLHWYCRSIRSHPNIENCCPCGLEFWKRACISSSLKC